MTKTTDGDKVINENCEGCCYRLEHECHFASPNGSAPTLWPSIKLTDWCGRFKVERKKIFVKRATEAAIIAVMDVIGESPYAEFVARVATQFGIHSRSAEIKVERLILRHKLDEVEGGGICLGRARKMGRPKKGKEATEEFPATPDNGSVFGKWHTEMGVMFGGLENAAMFSELRDAARVISPISNAGFSAMLKQAMAAGEVIKTEEKKYWLTPLQKPVTPEAIEAPE